MENNIHELLARHLAMTGLPFTDGLVDILKENFTTNEAKVAMMLPATDIPLKPVTIDEMAYPDDMDRKFIAETLENLAARKLIFSSSTETRKRGYALHQAGFGFPQSFFWTGKKTAYALKMTKLVLKYFNRTVTQQAFGGMNTKAYRYIPVHRSLKPDVQAVLPHDRMDQVLDTAERFAVAHCSCRVQAGLMERACDHPLEVCLKFDEMADYLIEQGLGRKITRKEAKDIVRHAAEAGLVHFVDNAAGKVKHNCNCCGCSCWNVGMIRRRRIPRDELMAVYFIRRTDPDLCTGCEACFDICPVAAITLEEGMARVDENWCIGCGVCAVKCEFDAVNILYRKDPKAIPTDFETLHKLIREQDGR
ncbi:MAG: 4Fe-4S binding protein [Proteobacteria bacterium]|nr:4Fe-4S binding protein [Pseudomonadota bacterium]MBU1583086.1 4Fe-4S binding protein [Pseudomonadota bacterium]MBU2455211.1 4Fe-4S binding protein [Pseudomonadota bacterium]MBU2630475.1 4Fe-4S binding protein [Pseudomonadota bacterium]